MACKTPRATKAGQPSLGSEGVTTGPCRVVAVKESSMRKHIRRWYVLATALVVAVFLLPACSGKNDKKEDDKKETDKKGDEKKGVADAKPDFTLTSKEFAEEYQKDQKAATEKYKGKVVELSGTVIGLSRNVAIPQPYLSLQGVEKDPLGIWCLMADKEPWLKATPGQSVKMKGKASDSFGLPPQLLECVVTEVSGPGAPTLTAEELGKAYAADENATTKKYDNKYLFLTGEIDKVTFDKVKAADVVFKVSDKPKIVAKFTPFDKEATEPLKGGQKIKVLGQWDSLNFSSNQIILIGCILVEERK